MALEQYAVQLTPDERERLSQLIRSGKSSRVSSPERVFYLKLLRDGTRPRWRPLWTSLRVRCTAPNGGTLRKV